MYLDFPPHHTSTPHTYMYLSLHITPSPFPAPHNSHPHHWYSTCLPPYTRVKTHQSNVRPVDSIIIHVACSEITCSNILALRHINSGTPTLPPPLYMRLNPYKCTPTCMCIKCFHFSLHTPLTPPHLSHHHTSHTTTPLTPPHLSHHHTSHTTTPLTPPHLSHHDTSHTTTPLTPPHLTQTHLSHHHTSHTTTPLTPPHLSHHHTSHTTTPLTLIFPHHSQLTPSLLIVTTVHSPVYN